MSNIKHVTGNLIDLAEAGNFNVIVHGCNCFTTMGGGIAREIANRYPSAAEADRNYSKHGDYTKLGNWSEVDTGNFIIINAYTQYNMSSGEDVFEYTAFHLVLQKLAHRFPSGQIGLPYIGMGLAGGDSEMIMSIIEDFADNMSVSGGSVTLVEFG
jgi:O-acetyl-ADP-ribose deacetylase (regulator of RNase III)